MQGVSDPAAQKGVIPRAFEHIFESIQVGWETIISINLPHPSIYSRNLNISCKSAKAFQCV